MRSLTGFERVKRPVDTGKCHGIGTKLLMHIADWIASKQKPRIRKLAAAPGSYQKAGSVEKKAAARAAKKHQSLVKTCRCHFLVILDAVQQAW